MGAYMRKQGRERQSDIERQLAELRRLYLTGGRNRPAATAYPLATAPAGTPNMGWRRMLP